MSSRPKSRVNFADSSNISSSNNTGISNKNTNEHSDNNGNLSRPHSTITSSRALTPAQEYREKLKTLTPHERAMRRLEWRWERDLEIWLPSCLRIQKLQRGVASRALTDVLRTEKQLMFSSCKIILKAGQDILRGKVEDAVFTLTRAIKSDPENKLAHFVRGRGLYFLGRVDEAVNDFSMVLTRAPPSQGDLVRLRIILGDIYHRPLTTFDKFKKVVTGTLEDSFENLNLRETLDMVKVCCFANRGRAHCYLGNFEAAVEDFTECIESRGDDGGDIPSMYFLRGLAFSKIHKWAAAVEDFTLNINLSTLDENAYLRRAVAYAALQDWHNAYDDYTKVIELNPTAKVYTLRARLCTCMRRWDDAVKDYTRALKVDPENEGAKVGLEQATLEHNPLPLISQHD